MYVWARGKITIIKDNNNEDITVSWASTTSVLLYLVSASEVVVNVCV